MHKKTSINLDDALWKEIKKHCIDANLEVSSTTPVARMSRFPRNSSPPARTTKPPGARIASGASASFYVTVGYTENLSFSFGGDHAGRLTILPEKSVRMAGEAIPSPTRIENEHFPTSAYQLQRSREPSVASADNDHVVHGSTHLVVYACLLCDARAGGRQRRGAERDELALLRRLTPRIPVSCAFYPEIVQAVDEIRLKAQRV